MKHIFFQKETSIPFFYLQYLYPFKFLKWQKTDNIGKRRLYDAPLYINKLNSLNSIFKKIYKNDFIKPDNMYSIPVKL